jgi:hypothetical protein
MKERELRQIGQDGAIENEKAVHGKSWRVKHRRWLFPLLTIFLFVAAIFLPLKISEKSPQLSIEAISADASDSSCWDPIKGHCYPRNGVFQWGGGPAEWYAKFDLVIVTMTDDAFPVKVHAVDPNTFVLSSVRDWNTFSGETLPSSDWYALDSNGDRVRIYNDSRDFVDITSLCPSYNGQKYNEFLPEYVANEIDLNVWDGISSHGVWEVPYKAEVTNIDLDRNRQNDYSEEGKGDPWVEDQWRTGVDIVVNDLRSRVGPDFLLNLNSGRFHAFNWAETNGLNLEDEKYMSSFKWFLGMYESWMEEAMTPHVLIYDAMGEEEDDYYWMRFHLGVTLAGDGYFGYHEAAAQEHYYVRYYDEQDLNLGYPTGAMQQITSTGSSGYGTWVRFFDNGAVILNVDNTSNSVTDDQIRGLPGYDGPYYRFQGGQNPEFNNGQLFDSVTLFGDQGYTDKLVVGDAILLTKAQTTMVTEIIIDSDNEPTSPGSQKAQYGGTWEENCNNIADAWSQGCRSYREQWAFAYANPGNNQAVFTPTINIAGQYEVFEWHGDKTDADEGTNVQYTINHANGSEDVTVSQRQNQGQWNSLGVYNFTEGSSGNVTISARNANGVVIADAIKFVYQGNHGNIKGLPGFLTGDLNQDSSIDALDVQLCINVILHMEDDPAVVERADVDGDDEVDYEDLELIVALILN